MNRISFFWPFIKLGLTDVWRHKTRSFLTMLGMVFGVGSVIATARLLYPSAVGGDLGCGMAAMRFAGRGELLADRDRTTQLLTQLGRRIPAARPGSAFRVPSSSASTSGP